MKLLAVLCVIGWSGFWVFGYLALTEGGAEVTVAMLLSALGLFTGLFSYLRLARQVDPGRWSHVRQSAGGAAEL